jgi:hypothetical protein
MLDPKEHQRLLQDTLDEEGGMDHDLTGIAEEGSTGMFSSRGAGV